MPQSHHENISHLVTLIFGIVQQGGIKDVGLSIDPFPGFISNSQSALVFSRIRNIQGKMRRQHKICEIGVLFDGRWPVHAGEKDFRGGYSRCIHGLSRLGEQICIDRVPSTAIHQDKRLPTLSIRASILRQGSGPDMVAFFLKLLHVAHYGIKFFSNFGVTRFQGFCPVKLLFVPKGFDGQTRNVRMTFLNHIRILVFHVVAHIFFSVVLLIHKAPRSQDTFDIGFVEAFL
mmetsp:Transcript_964/g.2231  ORF Transcript_964/g.2231 Transcript_964/m.2231 type:complete len:231 (+) Transcript_964:405-1097(+)